MSDILDDGDKNPDITGDEPEVEDEVNFYLFF